MANYSNGFGAIFVDVDPITMNVDLVGLVLRITPRTRSFLAVHVLGNMCDMDELMKICREHSLVLVEDTCESLGSMHGGKFLGTFGEFGTFSFYFSHHITTGEGGMVVCHTEEDADLLRCLRVHGWTRELSNKYEYHESFPHVDERFMFVNVSYNLRPLEMSGAIGKCQLARLDTMNQLRKDNRARLISTLKGHPNWNNQFRFTEALVKADPACFGFVALLQKNAKSELKFYLEFLTQQGIEHRPIISGNFTQQPSVKSLGISTDPKGYPGAEDIGSRGFFIGAHTYPLQDDHLKYLADTMLGFAL